MDGMLTFLLLVIVVLLIAALAVYLVVRKLPIDGNVRLIIEIAVWLVALIVIVMRAPIAL